MSNNRRTWWYDPEQYEKQTRNRSYCAYFIVRGEACEYVDGSPCSCAQLGEYSDYLRWLYGYYYE